jgi:hypothetical protein
LLKPLPLFEGAGRDGAHVSTRHLRETGETARSLSALPVRAFGRSQAKLRELGAHGPPARQSVETGPSQRRTRSRDRSRCSERARAWPAHPRSPRLASAVNHTSRDRWRALANRQCSSASHVTTRASLFPRSTAQDTPMRCALARTAPSVDGGPRATIRTDVPSRCKR